MNESNVFVDYMNRVRKSWVAKLSDETKELFKAMPQEERFKHYRDIDEKWLRNIVNLPANAAKIRSVQPLKKWLICLTQQRKPL